MLVGGDGPSDIEGEALVRQGEVKNSVRPQHPKHVFNRPDRIARVFNHVIGDDEVAGLVAQPAERFAVVDVFDFNQRLVGEFRAGQTQLAGREPVNISDLGSVIGRQREIQGSDFDSISPDIPVGGEPPHFLRDDPPFFELVRRRAALPKRMPLLAAGLDERRKAHSFLA